MSGWFGLVGPGALARWGVLGLNQRNAGYILPANPRAHYPHLDDKLLTKSVCQRRGIPVPQTYIVVQQHGEIRGFAGAVSGRGNFVIKPARGSGGRGILVVQSMEAEDLVLANGERLSIAEARYHLSNILSGLYSLAGQSDRAIVEQRIVRHPVFDPIAVGGTPDVRIIVYRGIPAMAMVRLPTRESRGRANLHQGAIAAAVDLRTGRTFGGVGRDRPIDRHPDTGADIAGLEIPFWAVMLRSAMDLADGLEMGYIGVDFVLDARQGPVVLEANARPGLAIQIANRRGLLPRLRRIDAAGPADMRAEERLELAISLADF